MQELEVHLKLKMADETPTKSAEKVVEETDTDSEDKEEKDKE